MNAQSRSMSGEKNEDSRGEPSKSFLFGQSTDERCSASCSKRWYSSSGPKYGDWVDWIKQSILWVAMMGSRW